MVSCGVHGEHKKPGEITKPDPNDAHGAVIWRDQLPVDGWGDGRGCGRALGATLYIPPPTLEVNT
jgi:hypothetical protein